MSFSDDEKCAVDGRVSCKAGELLLELRRESFRHRFSVTAFLNGLRVGFLEWVDENNIEKPGSFIIAGVETRPDFVRNGIATAMWNFAKENGYDLLHSTWRGQSGFAWSKAVGGLDHAGNIPAACPKVTDHDYRNVDWSFADEEDFYRSSLVSA